MKKILALILLLGLSIACLSGYLILNKRILEGSVKVMAGEKQIAEGELKLARGKKKLASGEKQLASGKQAYHHMSQATVFEAATPIGVPILVATLAASKVTGDKVSEGNRLVEQGKGKIKAGEQKLAAGKEELKRGIQLLGRAKWLRNFFGIGSIIFPVLFFILVYCWRPRKPKRN